MWSVGDGDSIRPFVDAWLPGRYDSRLGSRPVSREQASVRLEDWLDREARKWNEGAVRAALNCTEAQWVLDTPIPLVPRNDQLVWPFDRNGRITVRSAYHHLRSFDQEGQPSLDNAAAQVRPAPLFWDVI